MDFKNKIKFFFLKIGERLNFIYDFIFNIILGFLLVCVLN